MWQLTRFQFITAVLLRIQVFWDVTLCSGLGLLDKFLKTTLASFETPESTNSATLRHIPDHPGSTFHDTFRMFGNVHLSCTGGLDWSKLHGGLLLSFLHPSALSFLSFNSFLILSSLFMRQYNEFDYICSRHMYSFEHWDAICVNAWKLRVSMATSLERRSGLI